MIIEIIIWTNLVGYSPQHDKVSPFPGGSLTAWHFLTNSNPFSADEKKSKLSRAAKSARANSTSHYLWFEYL